MEGLWLIMQQELGLTLGLVILLLAWVGGWIQSGTAWARFGAFVVFLNALGGLYFRPEGILFGDVFFADKVILAEKSILSLATFIILMFGFSWIKKHDHAPEFVLLILSSLLGTFFMLSAGNLMIFYIGLELASIPMAALANLETGSRKSPEASLKMILNSAFSSGIFLFGISLLYGTMGTLSLQYIPEAYSGAPLQVTGFLFVLAGFAFKLSLVPFHLWTADVYEGSPVPVTAYFAVVSKGAVVFVFLRWLYQVFYPLEAVWYPLLYLLSALTITLGNIFALRQDNIKRFLAFSSVSQAGYLLFGISGASQAGTASVLYFVLVYVFSNLGAFAVVSAVSVKTGKEEIRDYNGFHAQNPLAAWVLGLSLFSLAGIPPTAGFFGKAFLLAAGAEKATFLFLGIAALNLVVSLYYYLRVIRAVFVEKDGLTIHRVPLDSPSLIAMLICLAGILILGFVPGVYRLFFELSFGLS